MAKTPQDRLPQDRPQDRIPSVVYDAALLRMSRDAVERSKKLLADTRPLVARVMGGSVIGARGLNLGEGGRPGDMQLSPDE
ncbi:MULTISPECIES: hypothetical protein [Microvirga]|uniref:hypothetical protein n=1 Tax=Microvirga TaxID=186650 RepID=UPI0021CAB4BD|nr:MULTISPECIES: hypothetical protein [unclassified Microvirga]